MAMTGFVLGAGAVGAAYALDRLALNVLRPRTRPPDRSLDDVGLPYERGTFESQGQPLASWHFRPVGEPRRPLVVVAHGWGASSAVVSRLVGPLVRTGFEVVLYDVRGHGENQPLPYVTVRIFRDDLVAVLSEVRSRWPDRPVVVAGHSLGGAAAVLAAADGAPVAGLVLIASPADVMDATAEYLTDHGMPGPLLVAGLRPFFWVRVGGLMGPLTPTRRIAEVRAPILILQPEHDRRIGRTHAERLAAVAGLAYHLIPGAEHLDVLEHPETLRHVEAFASRL